MQDRVHWMYQLKIYVLHLLSVFMFIGNIFWPSFDMPSLDMLCNLASVKNGRTTDFFYLYMAELNFSSWKIDFLHQNKTRSMSRDGMSKDGWKMWPIYFALKASVNVEWWNKWCKVTMSWLNSPRVVIGKKNAPEMRTLTNL